MLEMNGFGSRKRRSRHPGQGQRLEMSLAGQQVSSTSRQVLKASEELSNAVIPPLIAKHIGAAHLAVLMAGGDV